MTIDVDRPTLDDSAVRVLLACMLVAAAPSLRAADRVEPHPDIAVGRQLTAYTGPRFLTGEAFMPEAQTVVVDETGRVRALLKGPPPKGLYREHKLPGALAVAGLHDAHVSLQGIGQAREGVALLGAASPSEVKARVTAWASANPKAAVIQGRGWDQSLFPGQAWPTSKDLEGAGQDRPILLERVDGHAAWANARLVSLAGITKDTKDPAGGTILRDPAGQPTGVFLDNAMKLVTSGLSPPSAGDLERWLVAGLRACADAGLVAVHDMGTSVDATKALMRLDQAHQLPLRVFIYLDGNDPGWNEMVDARPASDHLSIVGLKVSADGARGGRGAARPPGLRALIGRVHGKGLAAAVSTIGDRGNRAVLDATKAQPAPPGVRDRIEHLHGVNARDFWRLTRQGIVASMQVPRDTRSVEQGASAARLKGASSWRSMLDNQVALTFGSNAPVEDERPQLGLFAAITHKDGADQRLSQREALATFAAGAAFAVGRERHLGALTPGLFFDVTLFSDDAVKRTDAGDPEAWLRTKPVGTLVGGVFREIRN